MTISNREESVVLYLENNQEYGLRHSRGRKTNNRQGHILLFKQVFYPVTVENVIPNQIKFLQVFPTLEIATWTIIISATRFDQPISARTKDIYRRLTHSSATDPTL